MLGATIKVNNYKIYSPKDFPAYLPKLNDLYDDLFSGGKGFRSYLVSQVSQRIHLQPAVIQLLAQTIEFIHNSSLLHDDLIDGSTLRRGKTAAWKKYSSDYAVLAGDYLLARVMVNLSEYGNVKLIHYTAEMISDLVEGEWLQDSIVGDFFISPQQLDRIHNYKTSSLFKWCLRAPFIAAEEKDDNIHRLLEELGSILGILFQRSDDLLDFDVRNFEGKAILGDLKSGYLNSFGAFLTSKMSPDQINEFVRCQNMAEVTEVLSPIYPFSEALKAFDEINENLIQLYAHHCQSLEKILPENQKELINELLPLPDLLYWRKQKK